MVAHTKAEKDYVPRLNLKRPDFLNADPRVFQIFTLSLLLILHISTSDFAPDPITAVITILICILTQTLCLKALGIKTTGKHNIPDLRSPLITSLSLSILLKAGSVWIHPLAAVIAISSKFFLRTDNAHIFNPANIGIVAVLLLFPNWSWISPAQWGSSLTLGFLLLCLAMLVLYKVPNRDMGPMFFLLWAVILFTRALWLGDPLAIPFLNLKSGALLIFSFFMISDPKTIPASLKGRFIFALAVCALAYILMFGFHIRAGLFYALAAVCLTRPLLDRVFKANPYKERTA